MRALLHTHLTTDPALLARVPAERFIERSSLREDLPRPFVATTFRASPPPEFGTSRRWSVEIYVYDDYGSYVRIDDILDLITSRVLSILGLRDSLYRITCAEEDGRSDDLQDDVLRANMKSASFVLVGGRR